MASIFLYDKRMRPIGPLDHVMELSYVLKQNDLSTATITLPQGDPQNALIEAGKTFARIEDGGRDIGVFRFGAIPKDEQRRAGVIEYELQSAQCTLLDDLLVDWHELGGTDVCTEDVMRYILERQTVKRWELGKVGYRDQYQYNFEDVTLLEALMSLGEVIVGEYAFIFDTSATPWTVSLVPAETADSGAALVYGRNVRGITRSVDATVVNRLYGRGYGEGDNQLTIASVNDGKPFLDAEDVEDPYDVRSGVHVDRRQTDPATLKARMAQILEMGKKPRESYEIDAIDYYRSTGQSVDHIRVGGMVRVLNAVTGKTVRTRVVQEEHPAAIGDPGQVKYTLSTGRADTAEALNEVLEKIGVQELYSQGATNMYSMQLSDNADETHPLVMRFYVPGNVLRINSCLIYWELERFRTYATLAKSGGGSSRTSKEGGGATVSTPQTIISNESNTGGPYANDGSMELSSKYTEKNEDGLTTGSKAAFNTGAPIGSASGSTMTETGTGGPQNTGYKALTTDSAGSHKHSVDSHAHNLNAHKHSSFTSGPSPAVTVSVAPGTDSKGGHTHDISKHRHSIEQHSHGMNHYHSVGAHSHSIEAHTHRFDHWHYNALSITIPPMEFELTPHTHTVEIPAHTHELEYGVYEEERAESVRLVVDGEDVPAEAIGEARELDVAQYLRKDSDGKVTRSTWHEVEFVPDSLTRITADLFFQVFIQSRGAGDY